MRQAVAAVIGRETAWSMGSLHAATHFGMDGEIGGLGGGQRADLVLLDDGLAVRNSWYGGALMVEDGRITLPSTASSTWLATATPRPPIRPFTCRPKRP